MRRAALLLALTAGTAQAADDGIDMLLEGFDEAPMELAVEAAPAVPPKPYSLSGSVAFGLGYTLGHPLVPGDNGVYDSHGLSRARGKLSLELEGRFGAGWRGKLAALADYNGSYALNGRDNYTAEFLDAYESELELGEAWVGGSLSSSVDVRVGRQIVVWGRSDSLRVTDVINPLDNREPGMVDIEDLRLPVAMLKLDTYTSAWGGHWGLSLMAIPEIRLNNNPTYGSEFYPAPAAQPDTTPDSGGDNTEYAAALKGEFSGWDLSLYRARYFEDTPYLGASGLTHARLEMVGAAANLASGNWLLKAEGAHIDNLGGAQSRDDLLLGFEYSGLRDTTLALELTERRGVQRERQLAARYSGEFMHARLKPTLLVGLFDFGVNNGGFARLSSDYELADGLGLSGGVISYWDGDGTMGWGENDRVFAEVKYSF